MFLRNVRSRNYLSWQRGLQYGYCTPCKYLVTRASVGSRDVSLQYCMYWYLALYVASGTLNTTCHERYATSMTLSKSIEIENKCDISLKRHIYSKNEAKMIFPTPPRTLPMDDRSKTLCQMNNVKWILKEWTAPSRHLFRQQTTHLL